MKPCIALTTAAVALAAGSEPTAPSREPDPLSGPALTRAFRLPRARLALANPRSTISQTSGSWSLTKVGALDPARATTW